MISENNPNANSLRNGMDRGNFHLSFDSKMQVRTTTLEEVIREFNLDSIDFLKMDCEGCEYGVINGLSVGTLKKIQEIRMEYHNGHQDLIRKLSNCGFVIESAGKKSGYIRATRVNNAV